ncbi:oxidoreductase [Balneatrix alpica]|uniref:oxidoreductase n=1 Tax=Balneatrix alpica TaxID=75684 RepID=UPI00273A3DC8|nr:oxidoreductase [Balneatrix alpica]
MLKTAVIGYGLSAQVFHLPFIRQQPELQLVAISSSQAQVRQDYPDIQHYLEAEQLIADTDAELVVITSPNDTHFPLARQALLAGKHVLVEKPFVVTTQQGEELIKLAKQQQRQLLVYHNRRYDGDFLTLQQLIRDQRLGQIRYFESHFDRFRPQPRSRWREQAGVGTGILFDLGPHLLDQALLLFGLPQALSAHCRQLRPGAESTDFFQLHLHYPDKEVLLNSSPFCANPNLRYLLQGQLGSYVKYGLDPQEDALRAGQLPGHPEWGQEPVTAYGQLYLAEQPALTLPTQAGNYQRFYQDMVATLLKGAAAPVSAEEALQGIRLIELAYQSSQQGRTLEVH